MPSDLTLEISIEPEYIDKFKEELEKDPEIKKEIETIIKTKSQAAVLAGFELLVINIAAEVLGRLGGPAIKRLKNLILRIYQRRKEETPESETIMALHYKLWNSQNIRFSEGIPVSFTLKQLDNALDELIEYLKSTQIK
ncbi:MAG: hypothetical protein ACFFC7_20345 [Candidatus Hermodarchaeota archaeon]